MRHSASVVARRCAASRAAATASEPSSRRSGGAGASARSRTTCATRAGSIGWLPSAARSRASAAPITDWYAALVGMIRIEEPAQSVRMPPGSTTVILIPRSATSLASTSENPPTAHLADW